MSLMNPCYPNLELLEYKVQQLLLKDEETLNKINKIKESYQNKRIMITLNFEVIVFAQTWCDTCTGFDVMPDGSAAWGGQAFTKEYSSIFHELTTDTYVVCFGDRPCYKVTNANEKFYEDLNKRQMASLSEAKKLY